MHQGQADQKHSIKLSSVIQQVQWIKVSVAAGGLAGLEVFTHNVGNGAKLQIELTDKGGKKLGTYQNKIFSNRFWAEIKVPANAKDELFSIIKMTKHGLTHQSPPLFILPPVEITNAKWDKKEARRGDVLKLTADVKGVPDGTEGEIEIWEHDSDGAHDLITKFPVLVKNKKIETEWEYEYHEDTDDIPTEEELQKYGNRYNPPEYFFRLKVGEVSADSSLLEFKDWIEFRLIGMSGIPLKKKKYKLKFADGTTRSGQTDDGGRISLKDVKPGKYNIEFTDIAPD
jgi:hypothetical protein